MASASYALNPADPRAPSQEQWDQMTSAERERVIAQLPSEVPRDTVPEGDPHRDPKEKAVEALREYFRRLGRRIYLSAELPVYYPGEREQAEQEKAKAEQEKARADRLAARLRELGVEPEEK